MQDPYAVLGVERGASKEAIKKAYRAMAKNAHPDAGGSTEKFGELQSAYDLLNDDARRAHYDKTGEFKGREPDNELAHLYEAVSTLLDMTIAEVGKSGGLDRITTYDILSVMCRKGRDALNQSEKFQQRIEQLIAANDRLLRRFRRVKRGRDNAMATIFHGRKAALKAGLATEKDKCKLMERVLDFLSDYEFDCEVAPPPNDAGAAGALLQMMLRNGGGRVF